MRHRFIPHLVLVFVLLLAQQAAFTHALSHLATPSSATTAAAAEGSSGEPLPGKTQHQTQICALCLLATLGDGVLPSHSQFVALDAASTPIDAAPDSHFLQPAAASFLARAPPILV